MAEEIKKTNIPAKKEEIDPQEKSFKRRKDLIKNFIIVFLVVMLVLTFFSNTIMNHSLPQVAVQYIQPGSITSVIRGEGTVESGDPYSVMVKQQKTVSKVLVKVGTVVHEGDILVSLDGEESEELKTAKETLETAENAYDEYLLSDAVTSAAIASSNQNLSVDELRQRISNAQAAVKAAEKTRDDYQSTLDYLKNQKSIHLAQQSNNSNLTNLQKAMNDAQTALEAASTALEDAKTNSTTALDAYNAAKTAETDAATAKTDAQAKLDEVNTMIALLEAIPDQQHTYDPAYLTDENKVKWELIKRDHTTLNGPTGNDLKIALEVVVHDLTEALTTATTSYNNAVAASASTLTAYNKAKTALDNAQNAYNTASDNYTKAKNNYDAASASSSETTTPYDYDISVAEVNLSNAEAALKDKEKVLTDLVADVSAIRKLEELSEAIQKAKEAVAKLEGESLSEDIKAPISGTILSVNVTSGKKTSLDDPVVTIQPEGQGFTMSFSVDNDKAKTITVGDEATVTNSWWYNDVTGVVATVRPDPNDANRKKLVTLNLQGSLTAGQTLTMSINSKTSNYDMIVPSSALKNDNKGDYVLVVESKSSPLGNRYFAVRYDVEILATDDIQTAIKGAFEGYEPVVTTATKDITEGQQIRLSEN